MNIAPIASGIAAPNQVVRESFFRRIVMRSVFVIGCAAGLPGCATLVTDDHQSIVVTSDPVGASCQVRQGGVFVGSVDRTPGTVYVGKSRHDIAIDCTRPGFFPGAAVVAPHFQDMTFGNIIYGGTVGVIVDTSSGAINEYPRWVSVIMKPLTSRREARLEYERATAVEILRRQ